MNISVKIAGGSFKASDIVLSKLTNTGLPSAVEPVIGVADVNADGKPDLLLTSTYYGGQFSKMFINVGSGTFKEYFDFGIPQNGYNSQASSIIADFDQDGKPDVLIGGYGTNNYPYSTYGCKLFKNTGSGFSEVTGTNLPNAYFSSFHVADLNHDSYPDLITTGRMFKNMGNNTFSEVSIPLGNTSPNLELTDIDSDGDIDILSCGVTSDYKPRTVLLTNDGTGAFTVTNTNLPNSAGRISIADVDGDGKPDILMAPTSGTQLYKNAGGGNFTNIQDINLPTIYDGGIKLVDLDNNGLPEILIAGRGNGGQYHKVLRNLGGGKFVEDETIFPVFAWGDIQVADLDGDGKKDVVVAGYFTITPHSSGGTALSDAATRIYKNQSVVYTNTCIAPTGCNTYTSPSGRYTWTASGVYQDTIHNGLYDSVITVNLLIDKATAKFTQKTDPNGVYKLLIVNKSKGKHMSYVWKFGDGDSSTAITPTHTYQNSGDYDLCLTITTGKGCKSTYCEKISLHGKKDGPYTIAVVDSIDGTSALAIKESPVAGGANLSFNIYPNPTSRTLNVVNNESDDFDMVIRDLSGREVISLKNQRGKSILDMSQLKGGMYFIEIQSRDRVGYYKVLKQ